MKYKNTKTGFVFEANTEIKGEDWVKLDPQPSLKASAEKTEPTRKTKRTQLSLS